ncbi:MAG: ImmA/IrrE family metallo-endopeptidase [Spirochaetaceae bacterium]|nr:ImmA/IrrE family metallo-endopeptidase [Spirochaetaceae bacterium]
MAAVRVKVESSIWDWVSNAASFEGVDEKVVSHFYKWKSNEGQPTYAQIENLSRKIHIPFGYFFLKTPPKEQFPLLEFRTVSSVTPKPSRNLMDTYYQMAAIQDWMRDYLLEQGNERLPFVGSCKNNENPEEIAAVIRADIDIAKDWYTQSLNIKESFNKFRNLFESAGILILQNGVVGQNNYRRLSIDEFRAFTLIDEYAPLIFINNNDTAGGKLFSLLHESVHIWLGLHSFFNENSNLVFNISPRETLCNAAAAELLVPNILFIDKWDNTHITVLNDKITCIAKYFKCGVITIARRALDNNYINQSQYKEFAAKIIEKTRAGNKNSSGSGDYYKTAISRYGEPLVLALDNSIKEGKTLYTEAFRLTGTNRGTFANLVAEIREIHG